MLKYIVFCVILFTVSVTTNAFSINDGAEYIIDSYEGRVINGSDVDIEEYPFMISLRYRNSHTCGGTLISPSWVLTAAHCTYGRSENIQEDFNIQHSSTNRSVSDNIVYILRGIIHEAFTYEDPINDIALLETLTPIHILRYSPIPAQFSDTLPGAPASVIGWGQDENGYIPITLQRGDFNIYSNAICSEYHSDGWTVYPSNICAGLDEGGVNACSGDSGGPLLVYNIQVGIASWAHRPCAAAYRPGVFTQVSYYREWIRQRSGV